MKLCHMSSKKTNAKSSIHIGLRSTAVLLAAGILFMMLFLSSCVASQNNSYPSIAFSVPYNQNFYWAPMAEPALDPDGILYYSGPYPNYVDSPVPKGAITGITITNGGTGYSANPVVAIIDVYGTGTGATATATVVRGVITAISIDPGASGSGYTAPIVAIIDATGRGATATAEMDGIPVTLTAGTIEFLDPQPVQGAYDRNSLPQYNPAAIPDAMTYPPGGKGYTSAPAIYITDITGRGANAAATVSGGTVTRVTMISGGSGYSPNPVVTFLGGGAATQAIGKATVVGGVITEIKLLGCDYYEIVPGEYGERLIDPAMQDYGWDYVYYCHLFSNEEMDMMHGVDFAAPPRAPSNLRASVGAYVILSWTDNSASETGFLLQRAKNSGFTAAVTNIAVGPNVVSYIDTSAVPGTTYHYRVKAFNVIGDPSMYPAAAVGFPPKTAPSKWSNSVVVNTNQPISIALQAFNGQYVCAEGGGGREVVANRNAIDPWETFRLIDRGNGNIALRASNGQYVTAENGGGGPVLANRNSVGPWETFKLIDMGDSNIALRASNGQYVSAEGGGGSVVVANRNAIGAWETFKLIPR